jgi:hypothetical protein
LFYPKSLRSTFKANQEGLRVIGQATNISKLTATTFETTGGSNGALRKAKYVSKRIRKGIWKGMPLFVLTLEEISTCPASCPLNVPPPVNPFRYREKGTVCYGANMPYAIRKDHRSPEFYSGITSDLEILSARYPGGFVLRLHELGDFFSVEYVTFWQSMLLAYEGLRIFGYSHCTGEIGNELDETFKLFEGRFNIMDSDATHRTGIRPTAVVGSMDDHTCCPQQTKKTPSCITCGLCMNGFTKISFLPH